MKYWLFQNNQVSGPFDPEQLAQTQGFGADVLVCPEGRKGTEMGDWKRASAIVELADLFRKGPAVATAAPVPAATTLPPEPTLQDLARVGNLQEKLSLLENAINQLKTDLSRKDKDITELRAKNSDLESKLGTFSGVQGDLQGAQKQIQDLQDRLQKTREELRQEISKTGEEGRSAATKLSDLEKRMQDTQPKPPAFPPPAYPSPTASPFAGAASAPAAAWDAPRPQIAISVPPPGPMSTVPPITAKPPVFEPIFGSVGGSGSGSKLVDIPAPAHSRDAGIIDVEKPKKRRGGIFVFVVFLAIGTTAALYYMSAGSRKPIGVARPGAPLSDLSPGESPKTVPPVNAGSPVDYSKVAEDFVKQWRIPSVGVTLEQRLESAFPPSGNLSPWFPQKLDDGKYQVNFYVRGTPLVYQFLVETKENRVSGINPPAVAVLNGAAPAPARVSKKRRPAKAAASPKAKPKKVTKARRGPSLKQAFNSPVPAPAPEQEPTNPENNSAQPTPNPSEQSQDESGKPDTQSDSSQAGSNDDNSGLSNMLLPGVPRRSQ